MIFSCDFGDTLFINQSYFGVEIWLSKFDFYFIYLKETGFGFFRIFSRNFNPGFKLRYLTSQIMIFSNNATILDSGFHNFISYKYSETLWDRRM